MSSGYAFAIKFALLAFPLIAAGLTIPYTILQYYRYKSVMFFRTVIMYTFILYLLCAYFLVIMPLPSIESVANSTGYMLILRPLDSWRNLMQNTVWDFSSFRAILKTFKQDCFNEPVLNVFLLMPLGVYLKYYFKCNWWQTILITFSVSLFFELTQLSGLYGIYPRPYRYFQTDDLINNTVGGFIGFCVAPIFGFFLPSQEKLDERTYKQPQEVSYTRRIFACLIDWVIIALTLVLLHQSSRVNNFVYNLLTRSWGAILAYIALIACYYILIPWILRGRTLGKLLLRIRLSTNDEKPPHLYQYIIRYGILYFGIVPAPFAILYLLNRLQWSDGFMRIFVIADIVILTLIFVIFIFQIFWSFFTEEVHLFYDNVSMIRHISTKKPR